MPRAEVCPAMVLSIGTASPPERRDDASRHILDAPAQSLDTGLHGRELARYAVKLLQNVRDVHVVRAEVVGDGVERMHGLVVVMAPPSHLEGELRDGRSIDDDKAAALADGGCGHLQKNANEVGERHAGVCRKMLGSLDLAFRHAHVNLFGMALHRAGFAPFRVRIKEAKPAH